MKNQFDSVEHHTEWTAYELARQDAIREVEAIKADAGEDSFRALACKEILAALKSEG